MDPTTLVTFLFRAQSEISTVELLGSWDNFQQSYRMHHDRRRGDGFFSGCFAFDNIIFDGDTQLQPTKPRSGGLKQGGTYWYYYRLNYDFEAFDNRQPHTTSCPLLPGQEVNIINVPTEVLDLPSRCHSMYGDIIGTLAGYGTKQTMDPANKFAVLSPPPVSRVHVRCLSDDALSGRLEGQAQTVLDGRYSPVSTASSYCERPISRRKNSLNHTDLQEPPLFDHDDLLPSTSDVGQCEAPPHSQPTFAEYIISSRSMVLSTLFENASSDDVPHQLAGRSFSDFVFPFHDNDHQPLTSDSSNSPSTNDITIQDFRPLSESSHHTSQRPHTSYHQPNLDDFFPSSPTSQYSIPSPLDSNHPTPDYEPPDFPLLSLSSPATTTALIFDTDDIFPDEVDPPDEPPILPSLNISVLSLFSTDPHHLHRGRPSDFWTATHYSLPSAATGSDHSLAKSISAQRSHSHLQQQQQQQSRESPTKVSIITTTAAAPRLELSILGKLSSPGEKKLKNDFWGRENEGEEKEEQHGDSGRSIAEAIWSELGYLGESIA